MRARAAVCLLFVMPLAGCGGGLSKDELVSEADAICKQINEEIAKEPEPKTAEDVEALAKKTVELSDPAIDDMEALEPPDELEKDFDAFVASLKKQRDLTKQIGDAAAAGDVEKLQQLGAEAGKAQEDYRRLSGKIGFKECGGGS